MTSSVDDGGEVICRGKVIIGRAAGGDALIRRRSDRRFAYSFVVEWDGSYGRDRRGFRTLRGAEMFFRKFAG